MTEARAVGSPEFQIEVFRDVAALEACVPQWSALAAKSAATQFGTPAYALAFWAAQDSGELRVVTAWQGDELVGLLPVYERRLGPARLIRWLGHGFGTVGQILIARTVDEDRVADAIWNALADASPMHVALQLIEYRADGLGLRALRRSEVWSPFLELRSMIPTIELRGRTTQEVLAGSSRRKLRHTISRAERDLEAEGLALNIEVVRTADHFDAVLPDLDVVFNAAEAHASKMHMFAGDLRSMSLRSIRQSMATQNTVVFIMRIDGQAVAFDISIVVNDTMFGYVRRHDPEWRGFSPGHLLMRAGVEWAIEQGIATFDLGLGDSEYKRRWATDWYDAVLVTGGRKGYSPAARVVTGGIDSGFKLRDAARQAMRRQAEQRRQGR